MDCRAEAFIMKILLRKEALITCNLGEVIFFLLKRLQEAHSYSTQRLKSFKQEKKSKSKFHVIEVFFLIVSLFIVTLNSAFAENKKSKTFYIDAATIALFNKKVAKAPPRIVKKARNAHKKKIKLAKKKKKAISKKSSKKSIKKTKTKHCTEYSVKTLQNKSKPYNKDIIEASAEHTISTALIRSIIVAESCFKPSVVSPQGATGLMQLMPATARRFGVTNLKNPKENIKAGTRYLRYLLDRYKGNVLATIAAYNAGEGAVKRFNDEVPNYKETKTYVKRVMSLYDKFYLAYKNK